MLRDGAIAASKELNTPEFTARLAAIAREALIWRPFEEPTATKTGFNECCVCWGQDEHDTGCPIEAILKWLEKGAPKRTGGVS